MLRFYPSERLHDYIREEMTDTIPAGNFYLQDVFMVPITTDGADFTLETDNPYKVDIYVNDRLHKTHVPKSQRDTVKLHLPGPPAKSHIEAINNVDAKVDLTVAATYMTTVMDAAAEQIFEVAGRVNDQYFNLLTSPWASFIVDWLLPWKRELSDVRSLRSMAVKVAANVLFGESGSEGGVRDMVSVFTNTTPVVMEAKNPATWQPELYQPYTSADDRLSWDMHFWVPNLCLRRWLAFVQYINNTGKHNFIRFDENTILIQQTGTEFYQQHAFDNTGPGCSMRGVLDAIGCLDRLTVAGSMSLTTEPSFCFWAHPFDMSVELPGIGGEFFDSGKLFDGEWVEFDSLYDIDLLTNYWLGTSTSKKLDGGCFDMYTDRVELPLNQECCYEGPDTKVLSTVRLDSTVTSPVTPAHPLYGGSDPGLVPNPYFGILG